MNYFAYPHLQQPAHSFATHRLLVRDPQDTIKMQDKVKEPAIILESHLYHLSGIELHD